MGFTAVCHSNVLTSFSCSYTEFHKKRKKKVFAHCVAIYFTCTFACASHKAVYIPASAGPHWYNICSLNLMSVVSKNGKFTVKLWLRRDFKFFALFMELSMSIEGMLQLNVLWQFSSIGDCSLPIVWDEFLWGMLQLQSGCNLMKTKFQAMKAALDVELCWQFCRAFSVRALSVCWCGSVWLSLPTIGVIDVWILVSFSRVLLAFFSSLSTLTRTHALVLFLWKFFVISAFDTHSEHTRN